MEVGSVHKARLIRVFNFQALQTPSSEPVLGEGLRGLPICLGSLRPQHCVQLAPHAQVRHMGPIIPCRVVARVKIPPTLVFDMIKTLNENMTRYEETYGEIRAPEPRQQPEPPAPGE